MTSLDATTKSNGMQRQSLTEGAETPVKQLTTAIEMWLAREIAQSLDINVEDISPDQPFDRYGVDSLEAINIACALEIKMDRTLSPTLIWEHPSISMLANHLAHEAAMTHPTTITKVVHRFSEAAS